MLHQAAKQGCSAPHIPENSVSRPARLQPASKRAAVQAF
uniref:Uncharacterized protein n=1 Tax=Parascaris equorum TaxID=6256 RepID=A0A914RKR5_PAREQ